ncbi:MAG: BREX-6 system BrxE protein [Myxococcales bacterium]|nr:BREX-6 system BrxE protein [Myxococcales bacterium]
MTDFELTVPPLRAPRVAIPQSEIDYVLSAQLVVAWAGEGGEEKRLDWWRTDLISEFGGEDLFRRLLPHTWRWGVFQAAREAASRKDAELRARAHDADRIYSLFSLGFDVDERIEERLMDLKRASTEPTEALPILGSVFKPTWNRDSVAEWFTAQASPNVDNAPVGRRIKGAPPAGLEQRVRLLVAALVPLAEEYPLPHFVMEK